MPMASISIFKTLCNKHLFINCCVRFRISSWNISLPCCHVLQQSLWPNRKPHHKWICTRTLDINKRRCRSYLLLVHVLSSSVRHLHLRLFQPLQNPNKDSRVHWLSGHTAGSQQIKVISQGRSQCSLCRVLCKLLYLTGNHEENLLA